MLMLSGVTACSGKIQKFINLTFNTELMIIYDKIFKKDPQVFRIISTFKSNICILKNNFIEIFILLQ
jgi:hypothetical protein